MFKTLMTFLPPQWVCSVVRPLKCRALLQKRCVMPRLISGNFMLLQPGTTHRVPVSEHVKSFSSSIRPFLPLIWAALSFLSPLLLCLMNSNCMCAEVKSLVSSQKNRGNLFLFNESWALQPAELKPCQPYSAILLSRYKKCNTRGEETAFAFTV